MKDRLIVRNIDGDNVDIEDWKERQGEAERERDREDGTERKIEFCELFCLEIAFSSIFISTLSQANLLLLVIQ